jgi:catechol 2,3-dioxygenase-like lactoylglutathione lyase family enzyme
MKPTMMTFAGLVLLFSLSLASSADPESSGDPQGMTLRLELFVKDMDKSVAFYVETLGFEKLKGGSDYIPVRSGSVLIGLGRVDHLPNNHYFNPEIQTGRRGAGVEIVLELEDIQKVYGQVKASGWTILSPLQKRPWGLTDFRIADPDGYYLRITSR